MPKDHNFNQYDVIIVGGGISGLVAANELHQRKKRILVVEANDRVGGRIQTDDWQGFKFDHGFQVYLTAYPTASSQLSLPELRLGLFSSGALVRINGKFHRLSDPWRDPLNILQTAISPIGSVVDKLRIAALRASVINVPSDLLLQQFGDLTTRKFLENFGFSNKIIDRFFRPFFGGIFLDGSLESSASLFRYLFQMFSLGSAALPAGGMVAIPNQVAARLPSNALMLGRTVTAIDGDSVTLDSGDQLFASRLIVAIEQSAAARLLQADPPPASRATVCYYFGADKPPINEPILMLGGDANEGPINSVAVLSLAQTTYAPPGKHLISVSCLKRCDESVEQLLPTIIEQLSRWYGSDVQSWNFLRAYYVPVALPDQSPTARQHKLAGRKSIILAGDYRVTGSIEGAIQSGLSAARSIA